MTTIFHRHMGMTILAAALISSAPACAQTGNTSPIPPAPGAGPTQNQGDWKNEKFERQEFREEMEEIRKEHEDLEREGDRLVDRCINAQGAQAAQCEQEKQSLHQRREKLHERMHALHEKIEAARKEHREEYPMQGSAPWPQGGGAMPPPPQNNGTAPSEAPAQ